ncbi:MAG: hypothetical protein JWL59_2853 [Chthoniobacteraceae bacterium]|nr:hypothetical protein [Chthoniobacteraceae bacterium]
MRKSLEFNGLSCVLKLPLRAVPLKKSILPMPKNLSRKLSLAPRLLTPLTAGLAFSSGGTSSAEIVYNGVPIQNSGGSTTFSIQTGNEFTLEVFTGFTFQQFSKPSVVTLYPTTATGLTAQSVARNSTIGSGTIFNVDSSNGTDVVEGQNYYGFEMFEGSEPSPLYGWISVTHSPGFGNGSGTVNEWAYENNGDSIKVGEGAQAVPEPSTALTGALLAGSAAVFLRRRRALDAMAA